MLALEINCDLLLMDERIGTNIARKEGLKSIGLVGVLIEAKQRRVINNVKEILDNLNLQAGFWLSENLREQILKDLNEL